MKIGELAEKTGVLVETIRYYEAQGLLHAAARNANNYREYSAEHFERLTFIQRCRSLDLSQDEVRALIELQEQPSRSCTDVNVLLDSHLRQLAARIHELQSLQRQIQGIRDACSGVSSIEACAAMESLSHADAPIPAARKRSRRSVRLAASA